MWVWGGCCCDFDFVGVLYGVCKNIKTLFKRVIIIIEKQGTEYIIQHMYIDK